MGVGPVRQGLLQRPALTAGVNSRMFFEMSPEIANFTPALFWDVDREGLDIAKRRALIVQRVLERGHDSDWELLKRDVFAMLSEQPPDRAAEQKRNVFR